MSRPFLIVETPRAGELGHRFFVPPSVMDETYVARIAAAASREPRGTDYLSVTREVEQRLASGSVRRSPETIILTGIDVERLGQDVDHLLASLKDLWPEVDRQVATIISGEWPPSRGTLIAAQLLDQWMCRLDPKDQLPVVDDAPSDRRTRNSLALPAVALLILALVAVLWMLRGDAPKPRNPILPSGSGPSPAQVSKTLERLAKRWACDTNDLTRSLQRAINWDRIDALVSPDSISIAIASDEVLQRKIEDLVEGSARSCLGFIESERSAESEVLRDLLGNGDEDDARRLRSSLFEFWGSFVQLREKAQGVADELGKEKGNSNGFARTIAFLGRKRLDAGIGSGFAKPATPIMDRQDLMIVSLIEQLFREGSDHGLSDALQQSGAIEVLDPSKLAEKLRALGKRRHDIQNAMKSEPFFIIGNGTVKSCYDLLGQCFDQLGQLAVSPASGSFLRPHVPHQAGTILTWWSGPESSSRW